MTIGREGGVYGMTCVEQLRLTGNTMHTNTSKILDIMCYNTEGERKRDRGRGVGVWNDMCI